MKLGMFDSIECQAGCFVEMNSWFYDLYGNAQDLEGPR